MRPRSELRRRLEQLLPELADKRREVTWRDLQQLLGDDVPGGRVRQTVRDIARSGALVPARPVSVPGVNRPMVAYVPAEAAARSAEPSGLRWDLGAHMARVWK